MILLGCGDGNIRVFNSLSGRLMYTWNTLENQKSLAMPVTCVRYRPISSHTQHKGIALVIGNN